MPVLGRAQPWHKKWEFQNICCLIQGRQVYSFICSQTLWKTAAICHELKVNWSKIAVDYCGHCYWKRCPVSQQLQELLTPGSSTEPRNPLAVPAHPRGSAETWGRRCCREQGGHIWNKPMSLQHQALARCLGSLLALGTGEAPSEPPSSLGTPCPPFHANTGSYW